jgi:hypothetical protein
MMFNSLKSTFVDCLGGDSRSLQVLYQFRASQRPPKCQRPLAMQTAKAGQGPNLVSKHRDRPYRASRSPRWIKGKPEVAGHALRQRCAVMIGAATYGIVGSRNS